MKLIPEGTQVKKGDVLAVLDSTDYAELVRLQRITVERALADKLQSELDHEIARLAVVEYRDGTMKETIEDYQRRVTLARSDLERSRDRLNWTHSMKDKGYVSTSTVKTDEYTVAQLEQALKQEEGAFDLFRKFTAPKTIRELEGVVLGTQATLDYEKLRSQRHLDRLKTLERQVDHCTIRAPHDGYVIYANDPRREIFIEEGMPVRQNQKLFYLPDLTDMEVVALLNESIVSEVRAGMPAQVRVEGMPDRLMQGHVTKIGQVPLPDWRSDVPLLRGDRQAGRTDPGPQARHDRPRRAGDAAAGERAGRSVRGRDVRRRPGRLLRDPRRGRRTAAGEAGPGYAGDDRGHRRLARGRAGRPQSAIRRNGITTRRRSRPPPVRPGAPPCAEESHPGDVAALR